jgi:CBS domain containing-hemolysin-like protein
MHHMNWGLLIPLAAILAWVANNWIRARHGYPLEGRRGRRDHREGGIEADRQVHLLSSENEKLTNQVLRLEERIAVLERIATDPATRVAREIESLR